MAGAAADDVRWDGASGAHVQRLLRAVGTRLVHVQRLRVLVFVDPARAVWYGATSRNLRRLC